MARIAYILLCHKNPKAIILQAQQLSAAGDYIAIHFDASAPKEAYSEITAALKDNPNVTFAKRRVKCGWGEWSLVQATLNCVQAAVEAFPRATHFYMVSGDCSAIKSATYAHDFLDASDHDFIESYDYFESDWIKTGFKEERLIYRHWFNERTQSWLFYRSYELQKRFNITRDVPHDLKIMIGSQWWCLRRRTIELVLDFVRSRPDVMRFFKTTWIPDETFFQTIVRHVVPSREIQSRTLTFLMFTDYGMPATFYNDHYDLLLGQEELFARKISAEARELRERLGELYVSDRTDFPISNEGRNLFGFLTGRGRVGRRFAPRFWETGGSLDRDHELYVVACKKWHVAKRLVETIRQETDIPALEYLFDEQDTALPDLGGIEATIAKRGRHRRALMRLLYSHFGQKRMVICLDTAQIDLMRDFFSDRSKTRMLEIDCTFDDDYLKGHAKRVGLAGEQAPDELFERLLPTIRQDMIFQRDEIRDAEFPATFMISETAPMDENIAALMQFLKVNEDTARKLAETPYLFSD